MRFISCLLLLAMSVCVNAQTDGLVFRFNKLAGESFIKKNYINSKELSWLGGQERCFLEKTITTYLDDLNNSSLSVIDSFYVRSYFSWVDGLPFSFVASVDGNFYFMYSGQWQEYLWNENHTYDKNDGLVLKDSSGNFIVSLSVPFLNMFIQGEINGSSNIQRQGEKVSHLLPYLFPELLKKQVMLNEFQLAIDNKNERRFGEIVKVLNPLIYRASEVLKYRSNVDFEIYENAIGYVFIHYKISTINKENLQLDLYFVPNEKRPGGFGKVMEARRYMDCLKKFQGN